MVRGILCMRKKCFTTHHSTTSTKKTQRRILRELHRSEHWKRALEAETSKMQTRERCNARQALCFFKLFVFLPITILSLTFYACAALSQCELNNMEYLHDHTTTTKNKHRPHQLFTQLLLSCFYGKGLQLKHSVIARCQIHNFAHKVS